MPHESTRDPPADSNVDVRSAARAWAAANSETQKQVSREVCAVTDKNMPVMVYAGCQKHDTCVVRWRFQIQEGERVTVSFQGHRLQVGCVFPSSKSSPRTCP